MTDKQAHSRLLNNAARQILAPEGIFQKGRSRTWIDDHGWWIIVIEFQPSSWSRGSYLNVGAMWLWHEQDYFSFDSDGRVTTPFIKYVNDDQFAPEARKLAQNAVVEARKLRKRFASLQLTANYLKQRVTETPRNPWTVFHAAMSLGCAGRTSDARTCFKRLAELKAEFDWETKLQHTARQFENILDDPAQFLTRVQDTIARSRSLLKLPEREIQGLEIELLK